MRLQKVEIRELLAPLIISQAGKATGGGVGVNLALAIALTRQPKKKKKKLDKAKILKMLWALRMIRKMDSLTGGFELW